VVSDGENGGKFSIHAASAAPSATDTESAPCLEFENEVLILDLVADVGDLVKAFASNLNRATPSPMMAPRS